MVFGQVKLSKLQSDSDDDDDDDNIFLTELPCDWKTIAPTHCKQAAS